MTVPNILHIVSDKRVFRMSIAQKNKLKPSPGTSVYVAHISLVHRLCKELDGFEAVDK